jgi:erythritol kinase
MNEPMIVALDSGTSVVKAVAFDATGNQLGSASRPNAYDMLPGGGSEQDMARTWDDAAQVLAQLTADLAARYPGRETAALAVTGQGDGTWLINAAGEPVGPGLLWLDSRGAPFVESLKASGAAQAAFAYTGTGLAACQQVPQLLWLERHRPDMIARATHSLHPKDFLYLRLTGTRATSPCEGCFTFGDFRTRSYRAEVLQALDVERFGRLLPPILDGTREARPLAAGAASRIGLRAGLPVVLGHVDVACTTLGAGIYDGGGGSSDGDTGVTVIGSTGMHIRLVADTAHVAPSPLQTGYCMVFPIPGHTLQAQSNLASTINLDWVAGLAADAATLATGGNASRGAILRKFDETVLHARPGAVVYHPFISTAGERGPFTDAFARAAILGIDQDVRLMDLVRGVYEGLCFAARDCYAAIGGPPSRIRVTGGAARSLALRAMLAACLDRPVYAAAHEEAGAAGAAMMAAVQIGLYADMAACAAAWIAPRVSAPVEPDPALAACYARLFPIYRDAYHAMPALWRQLHAAREDPHHAA